MNQILVRLRDFFQHRQLILAVVGAIIVALVMTVVSLRLYGMDYISGLDVSLPGREDVRKKTAADISTKKFDANGPVDAQALSDFQALYDESRTMLSGLGRLDGDALSDASLQVQGSNE